MTEYNGWTNYATWRVNLEIFDGIDPHDFLRSYQVAEMDAYELGLAFKDYAETMLEDQARGDGMSLVFSYAMAFLQDVNWREIAKHKIEEYADDESEAA